MEALMKTRILAFFMCAVMLFASSSLLAPVVSAAKVTSEDYDADYLACDAYDVRKYITPFWRTNVIWNENFFPLLGSDGKRKPISLLYKADEILSIHDYTLEKEYVIGRDCEIDEDGNFVFVSGSRIKRISYFYIHSKSMPSGATEATHYPRWDGNGYEYWNESSELSLSTMSISYIHNDTNQPDRPASIQKDIPNSFDKMVNGEEFRIVLLGDSVSTGAKASGNTGVGPYADAYPEMTKKALSMKYSNANIKLINSAHGGATSDWEAEQLEKDVVPYSPDLVILSYGMNDGSADRVGYTDERFRNNMVGQIEFIKEKCPDAEILLVSSLIGNPYCFKEERYAAHAKILGEIADKYDGVAFCDPQAIERFYLERKQFVDIMADNLVHPNDTGMRIIAQTLNDAFRYDNLSDYISIRMEQLTKRAELDKYAGTGRHALLTQALELAEKTMREKDDDWDVTDVYEAYCDRIDEIIRQCDPADHILVDKVQNPLCDADGRYYKECTTCGYQETTEVIPMLGGSHLWDSGFLSVPSGYRQKGTMTYTCQRCAHTMEEAVTEKQDGEATLSGGMLEIMMGKRTVVIDPPPKENEDDEDEKPRDKNSGYNYMCSTARPYVNNDGTIEFDLCPLDTKLDGGTVSYAGVRLGRGYEISAAYNFSKQRFEIVNSNLPYSYIGSEYKVFPFKWKSLKDSGSYTWHKIAVNLKGDTLSIYCDGQLVLQDENPAYSKTNHEEDFPDSTENNTRAMIYSIGTYCMDNIRVSDGGYDPTTGEGTTIQSFNLDTKADFDSFNKEWGFTTYENGDELLALGGYTDGKYTVATEKNLTSGVYANHVHTLKHVADVEGGCANCGTKISECTECGALVSEKAGDSKYGKHTYCMTGKGKNEDGVAIITYGCKNCDMKFTEIEEEGSPRLSAIMMGDANGDGNVSAKDVIMTMKYMLKPSNPPKGFVFEAADMDGNGSITAKDIIAIMKAILRKK